jgi:ketosteroid isomerase-like protein
VPDRPGDVVRASLEAWRSGDFERSLSYYAEDVTWQTGGLDSTVLQGREGVARGVKDWIGAFSGYWLEADELIERGDCVLLLLREGGTGKASGVEVEEEGALLFRVRDGLIVRAQGFTDRAEALRVADLPGG